MKVGLSPRAEADVIRQFRYYLVGQDAPSVAMHFREAVIESIEVPHLRSWPVRGFEVIRIYYQSNPGRLFIVRVLHGNRNVREILKREALS